MNNTLPHALVFAPVGFLFVVLAIPMIRGWVKPNRWYGFRTRKTFSTQQIWYAANRASGYEILLAGLTIVVTAITTEIIQQAIPPFPAHPVTVAVFLLAMVTATVRSFQILDQL
jgi:uncharacterized membrane protein